MNPQIIDQLFTKDLPTIESIEQKYPPRTLQPVQMVTRVAPSPTGFMHIGTLYMSLISERLAHQSNGIFFVRLEDTDKKREVAGANDLIIKTLDEYGVLVDEGRTLNGSEIGSYGPYTQSERENIYRAYIKRMVTNGQAYPCFCSSEELELNRKTQESLKLRPGYYGQWAKCRNLSDEQILEKLNAGVIPAIRLKSPGNFNQRINCKDLLKGNVSMPENDQDVVVLKSEGLPTYHMAHVIDDHLMGTTHVTRGDEWLASLPLHLQLFQIMGWPAPQYAHLAPIQKIDQGGKRKLSKRKDPEASMSYYSEQGYPRQSVLDYLMNLANSNFEDWRKENLDAPLTAFTVSFEKLANSSGALFDFVKLGNISKEIISRYSAEKVYQEALSWVEQYDQALAALMKKYPDYTVKIFNIERVPGGKVRKDIAKWSDTRSEIEYFYDELFTQSKESLFDLLGGMSRQDLQAIVTAFFASYDPADSKEVWFEKIKTITRENQFADNMKEFKTSPEKFKGSIVDVTKVFRVFLTGKTQTPDLYEVLQVMGLERVKKRLGIVL
jgi:glutamyl-tRNA synthetase